MDNLKPISTLAEEIRTEHYEIDTDDLAEYFAKILGVSRYDVSFSEYVSLSFTVTKKKDIT